MKIFEEMETEDGYMKLIFKDRFKSRQRSKGRNIVISHSDSSLKLHYSLRKALIFE